MSNILKVARRILSDWLYAVGDWLDNRAYSVRDLAGRIRPRSTRPSGPISEIITATLRNRSSALAENVMKSNALLRHLRETK